MPGKMETKAQKLSWGVLLALGVVDLGRGGFHWLAPDSGAGVVAGMNLSYPNARDVVFLLSLDGVGQIFWGITYLFLVFRARRLVPFALLSEVARGLMVLVTEYWLKPPVSPVPGRFMHMATTVVCGTALLLHLRADRCILNLRGGGWETCRTRSGP
jgi:hypothetical protein